MNTSMNGKKISTIGLTGSNGELQHFAGDFELSASHHGDHDEFWVVVRHEGSEVARYNVRHIGHIVWEGPKPQSPLRIHRTLQLGDRVALKADPECTGAIEHLAPHADGWPTVKWDKPDPDELTALPVEDLMFFVGRQP